MTKIKIGQMINAWEVVEAWTEKVKAKSSISSHWKTMVRVKCPKCKDVSTKTSENCKNNKQCLKCRNVEHCPFGHVTSRYYNGIKGRAIKQRNMAFSVTLKYVDDKFKEQNGLCAYSGRPLQFTRSYKKNRINQTASLDRIDSSKGYIEGNVQWIHKDLQFMKTNKPHQDFINWCKEISSYQQSLNFQAC